MLQRTPTLVARPERLDAAGSLDRLPTLLPTVASRTRRLRGLRWVLLALFPLGYLICDSSIGPLSLSFAILTLVNTAGFAILLARLTMPLRETLWVWAGLFILLDGLFINMFVFTAQIHSAQFIGRYYSELTWVTGHEVQQGYAWMTLGFVTYCISATLALAWKAREAVPVSLDHNRVSVNYSQQLVVITFVAYVTLSVFEARLGYGVLGRAAPNLPLHLGSAFPFLRDNLAIALLVLGIWALDSARARWTAVAMALAVTCAVIDGFVSTSRGSLITLLTPVLLLLLLTKRFTRSRRLGVVLLLLATIALVPFFSSLRHDRVIGHTSTTSAPAPLSETISRSAMYLLTRANSIDGIYFSLGQQGPPSVIRTLSFLSPGKLVDYYTHTLAGVKTVGEFRSPGFIGGLMIVGGAGTLVLFTVLYTALIRGLWLRLLRLHCWPVGAALAASSWALFLLEGSNNYFLFVKVVIEVALCEVIYCKFLARQLWASTT